MSPRLVLLGCAALAGVPAASARSSRVDTVTASVHKTGRSGTALVYKGTVRSRVFGTGRVTEYIEGNLTGRFVIRYRQGTVRGRSVAHASPTSGGKLKVSGTYRLTGGSGRYRNVRGRGTFTGSSSRDLQSASFSQHGRVSV